MDFVTALYPTMLICGFFLIIIVVGVGFSYLWLVIMDKRLRACPNCKKPGGGQVIESEIVNSRSYSQWSDGHGLFRNRRFLRITEKTYEDEYRCDQCGHHWIRTAVETERKAAAGS